MITKEYVLNTITMKNMGMSLSWVRKVKRGLRKPIWFNEIINCDAKSYIRAGAWWEETDEGGDFWLMVDEKVWNYFRENPIK